MDLGGVGGGNEGEYNQNTLFTYMKFSNLIKMSFKNTFQAR